MSAGQDPDTSVVRLFSDFAGSCVWFPDPVQYEDTGLSSEVITELRAWDQSYEDGLTDFVWRDPEERRRYLSEGERLARLVARELGDEFTVEVSAAEATRRFRGRLRRLRGRGPAVNPGAAARFRALAEQARADEEHLRRASRSRGPLRWVADQPADSE